LIRDRDLASSDTLLGRVGVFFGGLEAVECPSKNEIRSESLLGVVILVGFFFPDYRIRRKISIRWSFVFGVYFRCPHIYGAEIM
jgi:hypothetical protein